MSRNFILSFVAFLLLTLNSCVTYTIPIDSFKNQMAGIDSSSLKPVRVLGPAGTFYNYMANPIRSIKCQDKNGQPAELTNSPSIEIRITHGSNHKRTIFYFDRVIMNDTILVGVQSRFVSAIRKSIPLNTITKIEIQDGKKNFRYLN